MHRILSLFAVVALIACGSPAPAPSTPTPTGVQAQEVRAQSGTSTNQTYSVSFSGSTKTATLNLPTGIAVVGISYQSIGTVLLTTYGDQTASTTARTVTIVASGDSEPDGSTVLGILVMAGKPQYTSPVIICLQ